MLELRDLRKLPNPAIEAIRRDCDQALFERRPVTHSDSLAASQMARIEACEALVGWRAVASPENFVRMVKAADALVAMGWTDGSDK